MHTSALPFRCLLATSRHARRLRVELVDACRHKRRRHPALTECKRLRDRDECRAAEYEHCRESGTSAVFSRREIGMSASGRLARRAGRPSLPGAAAEFDSPKCRIIRSARRMSGTDLFLCAACWAGLVELRCLLDRLSFLGGRRTNLSEGGDSPRAR